MSLKLKKLSEVYGLKVFTEDGIYIGEIEDAVVSGNRIYGWKIKVDDPELKSRNIKGILAQHQLIKAIGQIVIISRVAYSSSIENREVDEEGQVYI